MRGYDFNVEIILNRMAEKNMDMKKLAKATGVAYSTIYQLINEDKRIYLPTAIKLANALDLKVTDIIKLEE